MKNLKTIFALLCFSSIILSCSKDEETKPTTSAIVKEYPASMIYDWNGSVTASDFGTTSPQKQLRWKVKANGVLEIIQDDGAFPPTSITGEWYMQGDTFYCSYLSSNGNKYTYKLLKNKDLNMVGFRGINGLYSGSGRVYVYVI